MYSKTRAYFYTIPYKNITLFLILKLLQSLRFILKEKRRVKEFVYVKSKNKFTEINAKMKI